MFSPPTTTTRAPMTYPERRTYIATPAPTLRSYIPAPYSHPQHITQLPRHNPPPALQQHVPSTSQQQYQNNHYLREYKPYMPTEDHGHIISPDCPVNPDQCKLPDCYCSRTGLDIPGGLSSAEAPQMIHISFDGPVTDRVINRLKAIFDGNFRNPNRCKISGTLFVTHVHNNYDQTQWLLSHGMEVGLSSMR